DLLALLGNQGHRLPPHRGRLRGDQGRDLRVLQELPQDFLPEQGPVRGTGGRRPRQPGAGRADGRGRPYPQQRQPAAAAGARGLSVPAGADAAARAAASDIPSLDRLLRDPAFEGLLGHYGQTRLTAALRARLGALRQAAREDRLRHDALAPATLARDARRALEDSDRSRLRSVFNL